MDNSTIVCRCEEINKDEIITAIQLGAETFDDVKRLTRCGMGPCQSKICSNLVREIIHEQTGISLCQLKPSRMRAPLRLIRMKTLADHRTANKVASVLQDSEEGGV
ncbi:(2Fe-2S)-binding protein [Virgibacillus chiguensis]|uniref:BFD-like [2Fe-2S] binding domain-containing protein n=1 Tax=Virgibacillus chiguensis TaxID=411959 RepID=A0A1M5QSQ5_9BACI|nr:(2Fe-2S)-binding protein [Virgibacillus chiguensis]SHH17185.1 BFD-like [2Fe-2S] binding domain-containing protein [Virgibacillus chiguensis]